MDANWARKSIKYLLHLPTKIKKYESSQGHINTYTQLGLHGEVTNMTQLNSPNRKHATNIMNRLERTIIFKNSLFAV